ncbi:MAG: PAS domain S-box protein [Rhodoblastus sp.]|uniref:PAS domain S-box protein n=1 Tax=Rhodoblastus sp. TaxID=1962975 RepID=UPI003F95A3DC
MSGENSIVETKARSRGDLVLRFFAALAVLPLRWRIVAAVLAIAVGFALRYALIDVFGAPAIYFTFFPAVLVAALLFGTYAGLAATAVAVVLVSAPLGATGVASLGNGQNLVVVGIFLLNCAALIFLARLLHSLAKARRESEELIRLNAEQLGHFVEQAPAAMAMFDRDMFYLAASARWRADFGLSRDIVGKSHYDVFPDLGEELRKKFRRALAGESLSCQADRYVGGDGSERWLRWEISPWRLPHDRIGGVVIFSEDITERLLIEEQMRENEHRRDAIVDAAMEAIVAIDSKGIIQSANPATREMFGYEKSELLDRNVRMLMPNHYRAEHDRYIADYLDGGKKKVIGQRRKLEGRRKDGSILPLELTVCETTFKQEIMFVGFLRDLSPIEEEKRRVTALRDDLVHVSRLNDMGEVVASLAHEVGQPVSAILNFAAAHRRAKALSGEAPEPDLIAKIEAQARRAAEILKRLRGFIEKRPPERRLAGIRELIEDAISLTVLRSRAHIVYLPAANDGEIRVCADRVQIGQVLVNLLRNADDALADTAEPEIRVETYCDASGMVHIAIADNGGGVDEEALGQIFSPFFSTKKYGMGVGLSISKSIVESHGGVISYRANEPYGSIFEFTLPVFHGDESLS